MYQVSEGGDAGVRVYAMQQMRKTERGRWRGASIVNCGRVSIAEGGLKVGFRLEGRHGSTRISDHAFLA
jgi:hypothetical protein